MSSINQLTSKDTLSAGDRFAIYSGDNGDTRSVSAQTVATFAVANIDNGYATQYAVPLTGSTVQVAPPVDGESVWLLMTPAAALASVVIQAPPVYACIQGQEMLVNSTQAVTSLFVNGNGANAVFGGPTTLAANGFFRMRFDVPSRSWFRV